jgi:hypothetical protein
VRIFGQDMDLCHLTGTVPAVSVCTVEIMLSLLGQYRLTGEGAALTRRARLSSPAADHHDPLFTRVRHCDVTARRSSARRAQ